MKLAIYPPISGMGDRKMQAGMMQLKLGIPLEKAYEVIKIFYIELI